MPPTQQQRWDELRDILQAAYEAETPDEDFPGYQTWAESVRDNPEHPMRAILIECDAGRRRGSG